MNPDDSGSLQPLVLDLHSMCTKYSPHRLHLPCRGGGGNGAVVEAADHARPDVELGGGGAPHPKAHFHLYEVSPSPSQRPRPDQRSPIVRPSALTHNTVCSLHVHEHAGGRQRECRRCAAVAVSKLTADVRAMLCSCTVWINGFVLPCRSISDRQTRA